MKKLGFIISICFLSLFLCSCFKDEKEYQELNSDVPGIRSSMNDFFRVEGQGSTKGDHFQAKFLTWTKVKFSAANYATGFIFYRCQIVIAPVTNQPIHIKKIQFALSSDHLMKYYKQYQFGHRKGFLSETVQIGTVTSAAYRGGQMKRI